MTSDPGSPPYENDSGMWQHKQFNLEQPKVNRPVQAATQPSEMRWCQSMGYHGLMFLFSPFDLSVAPDQVVILCSQMRVKHGRYITYYCHNVLEPNCCPHESFRIGNVLEHETCQSRGTSPTPPNEFVGDFLIRKYFSLESVCADGASASLDAL